MLGLPRRAADGSVGVLDDGLTRARVGSQRGRGLSVEGPETSSRLEARNSADRSGLDRRTKAQNE